MFFVATNPVERLRAIELTNLLTYLLYLLNGGSLVAYHLIKEKIAMLTTNDFWFTGGRLSLLLPWRESILLIAYSLILKRFILHLLRWRHQGVAQCIGLASVRLSFRLSRLFPTLIGRAAHTQRESR